MRDRALFDLAIDSKLRGCDLVKIKIGTLVTGQEIRTRALVVQQKTGRPVQFEITAEVRASLLAWLERRGGTIDDYAFPSRVDHADHLSTRQYARLVDEWVTAIGLRREDYGTYSLRRTKAAMIYKATGNLRAIQILLELAGLDAGSGGHVLGARGEGVIELSGSKEVAGFVRTLGALRVWSGETKA